MPTEKGDKQAITVWIDKKVVDQLDYLADKGGLTRSKFISNILEVVSHDAILLDKVGFVRMAKFYHEMRDYTKGLGTKFKDTKVMNKLFKNE